MTSMTASIPFTLHDLEGMPDDGRRYELIDGQLLVSLAPELRLRSHAPAPIYPGRGAPCPSWRLRNVHMRVAAVGDPPLGQACPRPG
jgi:hypothetical protein